MPVPEFRDDVPGADAAEQDRLADPTVDDREATSTPDVPVDADPADVLDQRLDAAPDDE